MKKNNVLYIANAIPYSEIAHAGGKTFNYYVQKLLEQGNVNITIVGISKKDEKKYIHNNLNKKIYPVYSKGDFVIKLKRIVFDLFGIIFHKIKCGNSFYKFYKIKKILCGLKNNNYHPDTIILEWTNMVLLIEEIKKIYPNARIIGSEHDVSFLGAYRKYKLALDKNKSVLKREYEKLKKKEVNAIELCDYVFTQSKKDADLLINEGIDENKIIVISPYYHNMSCIKRQNINHNILFWGAMYRAENYEAAIWFINNVMPLLADTDVKFIVVGNRPPEILRKLSSEKVIVTGFVEDETSYFAQSMCFVSPLLTGAGIKVKVLEALSVGIPILTNDIGIEGIYAKDCESFFYCKKPAEYANIIKMILKNKDLIEEMSYKQKKVIENYYDLDKSSEIYCKTINY